jgi:predicted permease
MGTRLVRGRWFTPTDTSDSLPIAVVNETMARIYWKDGAAIGGRIRIGSNADRPWAAVVGIVADERHNGVMGIVKEKFYVPHSQWHVVTRGNVIRNVFAVVRTSGEPLALAAPIRSEIRQLDPNLPIANVRPMRDVVSTAMATPRLTAFLLGSFAAIALVLAAVGIYGVLSYVVSQRTHEIGIRLAVGAGRYHVLGLVLRQGALIGLTGVGVGLAGAFVLTRLMQTLLYEVTPNDAATFITVPVVLLVIALLASSVPALRAMRVSPTTALRIE